MGVSVGDAAALSFSSSQIGDIHKLKAAQSGVDTLFIQRRSAHQYSALQGFACLPERATKS